MSKLKNFKVIMDMKSNFCDVFYEYNTQKYAEMFSVICILCLAPLNGDYKSPVWCSCVGCRPM